MAPLHDRFVHITTAERAALLERLGPEPPAALCDLVARLAPEQFTTTNQERFYRRAASDTYTADGEVEIDDDAIVSIGADGASVHAWVFVPTPDPTAQWLTGCPRCGTPLVVHAVTLVATGARVVLNTPLEEDGFAVTHPDAQDDGSTTDEVVCCVRCGSSFTLADLALDR